MKQQKIAFLSSSKRKNDIEETKTEPSSKKLKQDSKSSKPKKNVVEHLQQAEPDDKSSGMKFSNSMKDAVKTSCKICKYVKPVCTNEV